MVAPPENPPRARLWRVVWYTVMAVAGVAALFVEPALAGAVGRGALDSGWILLPIGLFCLLFLGYAFDRWRLVRQQRYATGRALVQTLFGVIFASVLLSSTISDYRGAGPVGAERLLRNPDPEIRRAAVYALGFLGPTPDHVGKVVARIEDRAPLVREAAAEVLSRWSGRAVADATGLRAWASAISASSTVSGTP